MKKTIIVHMLALSLALASCNAQASDTVDVDWPTSDKESHTLAITINGCETRFRILNKDFETFSNSDEALQQAVDKARERAYSVHKCK